LLACCFLASAWLVNKKTNIKTSDANLVKNFEKDPDFPAGMEELSHLYKKS
jgi:hypothetical protein